MNTATDHGYCSAELRRKLIHTLSKEVRVLRAKMAAEDFAAEMHPSRRVSRAGRAKDNGEETGLLRGLAAALDLGNATALPWVRRLPDLLLGQPTDPLYLVPVQAQGLHICGWCRDHREVAYEALHRIERSGQVAYSCDRPGCFTPTLEHFTRDDRP